MIKEKSLVSLFKKFPSDVRVGRLENGDMLYSHVFFLVRGPVFSAFSFPDTWASAVFPSGGGAPQKSMENHVERHWNMLSGKEGKRLQVSNLLYELPGGSLSKPGTFYRQLDQLPIDPTYLNKSVCDLFAIDLDQLREEYQFEIVSNRCVRIISKQYGICAYVAPLDLKK